MATTGGDRRSVGFAVRKLEGRYGRFVRLGVGFYKLGLQKNREVFVKAKAITRIWAWGTSGTALFSSNIEGFMPLFGRPEPIPFAFFTRGEAPPPPPPVA